MPNKDNLSFTVNFYAPDSVPTDTNQNIQDKEALIQSYLFVQMIFNTIYYLNRNIESFEENDNAVTDIVNCSTDLARIGLVFADKMHEIFSELLLDEKSSDLANGGKDGK